MPDTIVVHDEHVAGFGAAMSALSQEAQQYMNSLRKIPYSLRDNAIRGGIVHAMGEYYDRSTWSTDFGKVHTRAIDRSNPVGAFEEIIALFPNHRLVVISDIFTDDDIAPYVDSFCAVYVINTALTTPNNPRIVRTCAPTFAAAMWSALHSHRPWFVDNPSPETVRNIEAHQRLTAQPFTTYLADGSETAVKQFYMYFISVVPQIAHYAVIDGDKIAYVNDTCAIIESATNLFAADSDLQACVFTRLINGSWHCNAICRGPTDICGKIVQHHKKASVTGRGERTAKFRISASSM